MLTNFIVTIVAMLAVMFGLFRNEIKENWQNPLDAHNPDGVVKNGKFFGWGGEGVQLMNVGGSPDYRMYNGKKVNLNFPRTLGYQMQDAFPPECQTVKEGFVGPQQCYNSGIDAGRNMQTAPPPRFMVTGPKLEHYRHVDTAKHVVNLDKPIDHAEDLIVSDFGQVQMDSRKDVKENYDGYAVASVDLPKDMCNVNMLNSESQPVIYDRIMYSNIRSRTRGQGDYIRGDLMIAPDNYKPNGGGHPQWFQVSVKPERDLNPGCMEHLFGRKEELALGIADADIDVGSFGL